MPLRERQEVQEMLWRLNCPAGESTGESLALAAVILPHMIPLQANSI